MSFGMTPAAAAAAAAAVGESPSVAAADAAGVSAPSVSPSLLSGFLGEMDPELDEGGKEEAQDMFAGAKSTKKPKVDHELFFENPKGFTKMLASFSKIKFHGKGREFEDLAYMLKHYEKWFKDLYPYEKHYEDLVYKSRSILCVKKLNEDGHVSDPKIMLHFLRKKYKSGAASLSAAEEDLAASLGPAMSDTRAKIEANRKRALELKRRREGGTDPALDEDPIGFGHSFGPDDEDPFGFDGGLDDQPRVAQPTAAAFDDDDPFGFGGGLDDDPRPQPTPARAAVDPELARRIEENRLKALARKRQRTDALSSDAPVAPVPVAPVAVIPNVPIVVGPTLPAPAGQHEQAPTRVALATTAPPATANVASAPSEAAAAPAAASKISAAVRGIDDPDTLGDMDEFEDGDVFGFEGGLDEL